MMPKMSLTGSPRQIKSVQTSKEGQVVLLSCWMYLNKCRCRLICTYLVLIVLRGDNNVCLMSRLQKILRGVRRRELEELEFSAGLYLGLLR